MKRQKLMVLAFTAVCCTVAASVLGLEAAAASNTESVGDFSAVGNQVVWHSEDITYLNRELDVLHSEIDDSVFDSGTVGGIVLASVGQWRDRLTSHGTINYDNGKMVANAANIFTLADRTDALANAYAAAACHALNDIGTYFNTDGGINHASQVAGPIALNSTQIAAGILKSQSIEHLSAAQITKENITAGAAAWVNGKCIIGNGADNKRAYQRGIDDGKAGIGEDVDIKHTNHAHTGNSGKDPIPDEDIYYSNSNPGGCYVAAGHSHDAAETCPKSICGRPVTLIDDGFGDTDWENGGTHRTTWKCSAGHTGVFNSPTWGTLPWSDGLCHMEAYKCDNPVNTWKIGCGKSTTQLESVEVIIHTSREAFK